MDILFYYDCRYDRRRGDDRKHDEMKRVRHGFIDELCGVFFLFNFTRETGFVYRPQKTLSARAWCDRHERHNIVESALSPAGKKRDWKKK